MYQQSGDSVGFMELTDSQEDNYVSRGLQEFIAYYSNRLSYEDLSETFWIPIEDMTLQRLHHYYSFWTKPLPLVVISDGARVIRQCIERMFGLGICVILD